MEWLNNIWVTVLLPFLSQYATTLLTAIVIGLIIGMFSLLGLLVKKLGVLLKNMSEKYLSEKVSLRVKDAIDKTENVLIDLISIQSNKIKDMANEAYRNDGKIDMKEVKEIAKSVGEVATKRLETELETITKYVAGSATTDFIEDKISAIVTQSVEKLVEQKLKK